MLGRSLARHVWGWMIAPSVVVMMVMVVYLERNRFKSNGA
jgi:hypothetical protein